VEAAVDNNLALQALGHHYNWHRPHRGIGGAPPVSRLGLGVNNLLQLHS
jgi:transposase InsO family protein